MLLQCALFSIGFKPSAILRSNAGAATFINHAPFILRPAAGEAVCNLSASLFLQRQFADLDGQFCGGEIHGSDTVKFADTGTLDEAMARHFDGEGIYFQALISDAALKSRLDAACNLSPELDDAELVRCLSNEAGRGEKEDSGN